MSKIEKLKLLGKEWKSDDGKKHRIYFNDLYSLYGLEINRYGTGNISSAYINGEKISNTRARRITTDLDFGKVYYDMKEEKFGYVGLSMEQFNKIIDEIERRIKEDGE